MPLSGTALGAPVRFGVAAHDEPLRQGGPLQVFLPPQGLFEVSVQQTFQELTGRALLLDLGKPM